MKGLKKKNGVWYIRKVHMGQKINIKTNTSDRMTAERIMNKEIAKISSSVLSEEPGWDEFINGLAGNAWVLNKWRSARSSSVKRKHEFPITTDEMMDIAIRSRGRCEFSGLPFVWEGASSSNNRRPFTPSFDRIDCSIGYTKDNLRLVCLIVNTSLLNWGDDAFSKMCWAVYLRENGAPVEHVQKLVGYYFK